jgi:dipeptidyl aminopeptidase/acylaminoacyl peptidase
MPTQITAFALRTLLATLACVQLAHAQTRGVTAEDYFAFETLGDPRFSPDGSTIAFVVTTVDQKQNRRRSEIWTVNADGSRPPSALTTAPQSSTSPRWSPDGRTIAFLSARPAGDPGGDAPRNQVWLLPLGGGEPRRLTDLVNGVTSLQWSPDSRKIAFVSDRTGKAFDASRNTDVWVVDANGGPLTKISDHNEADTSPRWSPDGRTIAFLSAVPERSHPKIWLAPVDSLAPSQSKGQAQGAPSRPPVSKVAADGIDLIPTALGWAEGGRALYFEAGVRGANHVYRVDLAARRAAPLTSGDRTVHLYDVSEKTGRFAFAINDPTHLDDLYVSDLNGSNERQLTQGEQWFRALQHFGVPSEIVFFPRENHNLTRTGEPKHLVESLNWQVYWFDRYLNGNANAIPPDAPARTTTSSTQDRQ